MKRFLFIVLALNYSLTMGQHAAADSAKPTKAALLSDSAVSLWRAGKYDAALPVINQAYALAKYSGDSFQMAKCLNNTGLIYNSMGDPVKSMFYCEQSLTLLRLLKKEKEIYTSLLNLGIAYKELAIYDKALAYLFECAPYFEKINDKKKLSGACNTIGNILRIEKQYRKALQYHFIALTLRRSIKSDEGIAGSLNNIGTVYKEMEQYDSALFYFNASLALKETNSKPDKMANTLSQIGDVYTAKEEYTPAENYYLRSYKIRRGMKSKIGIARSCYELGSFYVKSKRYNIARKYLLDGEAAAKESGATDILLKCYDQLKEVYHHERNDTKALYYANKYIVLNDQLFGDSIQRSRGRIEREYEMEQAQIKMMELNQENGKRAAQLRAQNLELEARETHARNLVLVIVLLGCIVLLLLILFTARYRFARKLDMVMREVHHRVKNNFQVLLSLFSLQSDHVKDDAAKAILISNSNRITAMMLIHRRLYENKTITEVETVEYIHALVNNLLTVYAMTNRGVKLVYKTDDRITMDVDKAIVLGLLINELVTNAFKYAFGPANTSPRLTIEFHKTANTQYRLTIKDNGPGMDAGAIKKSLGLKLAESQVKQLKGSMQVISDNGVHYEVLF